MRCGSNVADGSLGQGVVAGHRLADASRRIAVAAALWPLGRIGRHMHGGSDTETGGYTVKAELTKAGCTLTREPGDSRVSHESTVVYRMKQVLNAQGHRFVRMNPSRHGLTSCRLGLIEHKTGTVLWHERYAIENAATEFNRGRVWFMRVDEEVAS